VRISFSWVCIDRGCLRTENIWTKGDGVGKGSRYLLNEELRELYCSPSIIRKVKPMRMRWAGHVAQNGEKKNAFSIFP
jgi:hypothetical protein